jgi:radical SAM protein (TIGR01212 family)
MEPRYNSFSRHLKSHFGCRVHRISLDAGFTCPTRDGTKASEGCAYCDEEGSRAKYCEPQLPLNEQLKRAKVRLARRFKAEKFIAYFQPYTNTYAPVEHLRRVYVEALADPDVVGLAIGTRPDCVPTDVLDLLDDLNSQTYLWVEYGLQSAKNEILKAINRRHTVEDFVLAVEETKERSIRVCAHVILGLPNETREDMLASAKLLNELEIDGVKIHSLYISRNAPLAVPYQQGKFAVMELAEYVKLVCDYLERLRPEALIHRLVGEAPREKLIAPQWCLRKNEVLNEINRELQRRDTRQGSLLR